MRKINLLDILGLTDNSIINRAIETDSSEKLKELKILEKRKKHLKIFKYTSLFAGSFAVLIIGIVLFSNTTSDNNIFNPNSMIEIKDIKELESYIKLDLSKYKIKEIMEMYKFSNENLIQITYTDKSTLRISKGKNDNSGIYGATLKEIKNINNIDVKIYEFESTKYAIWKDEKKNYTYSYISCDNENIYDVLSKVV